MSADMLAMIADENQYGVLRRHPDLYARCVVASGDLDVLMAERQCGRDCVNLWDYLPGTACEQNEAAAWTLCRFYAEAAGAKVGADPCDIAERMQYDLYYAWLYALTSASVIEGAMEAQGSRQVICFNEMQNVPYWDPEPNPPDIFNATARWAGEKKGLTVRGLNARSEAPPPRATAETLQAARPPPPPFGTTISAVSKLSRDEQRLWLENAQRRGDGLLLFEDVASDLDLPRLTWKRIDALPYRMEAICDRIGRSLQAGPPKATATLDAASRRVLENPHLGFIWGAYHGWLEKGVAWYHAGDFLARGTGARVVVLQYDVHGWARCFAQGLMDRGTEVLSVFHGGLAYGSHLPWPRGTRGHVAVWGEFDQDAHRGWREPGCRVEAVGSLRPDLHNLYALLEQREGQGAPKRRDGHSPTLVLLTGSIATLPRPNASLATHAQSWADLLALADRRPDWTFVIKPHPRFDYAFYESPEFARRPNVRIFRGRPGDALENADVAVAVNYPSSVVVEAMARQVPVVYLRQAVYAHHRGISDELGLCVVDDVAAVERRVERFLNDPGAALEQARVANAFVRRALRHTGDAAVAAMDRVVSELSAASRAPAAEPAARWVIDLFVALDLRRTGSLSADAYRACLRKLGDRAGRLTADLPGVHMGDRLAQHFLDMVVWSDWPEAVDVFLPAEVMRLRGALPRAWRPSWQVLRSSLIHACRRQRARARCSRWSRAALGAAMVCLAPGRVRFLWSSRSESSGTAGEQAA